MCKTGSGTVTGPLPVRSELVGFCPQLGPITAVHNDWNGHITSGIQTHMLTQGCLGSRRVFLDFFLQKHIEHIDPKCLQSFIQQRSVYLRNRKTLVDLVGSLRVHGEVTRLPPLTACIKPLFFPLQSLIMLKLRIPHPLRPQSLKHNQFRSSFPVTEFHGS